MAQIDITQIRRFFAFGCSFTEYAWHTWADILAYHLGVPYYNRGKSGASNPYIAAQVAQMDLSEKFGPGDLVAIMWTNPTRQDIFLPDHHGPGEHDWEVTGNIYTTDHHDEGANLHLLPFVKLPPEHFLMRDLTLIKHTQDAVKATGAQCLFMSMNNLRHSMDEISQEKPSVHQQRIVDLFLPVLNEIKPDCFDKIWGNDLEEIQKGAHPLFPDMHPTPLQHAEYINRWIPLGGPAWEYAERMDTKLKNFLDIYGARNKPCQGPIDEHMQAGLGRQTPSRETWG